MLESDKGKLHRHGFVGFTKTFNTVNYTILLNKLKALVADEICVCWFRSYLMGRAQVTDVDGTMSAAKGITCELNPSCLVRIQDKTPLGHNPTGHNPTGRNLTRT